LIPSSDNAAALLARNHDDLARHYRLTSPPWEMLRWTYDKRLTYELAERMGVPYPRTIPATEALDDDRVSFPAILKPAVKEAPNALTTAKAWELANRAELATRYREAQTLIEPDLLMVQELVPGGGENQLSYAALCRGGEPLASLTARRTRQYPADFGRASTFVETVECTDIIEPSLRLLRELGYTGLIEIEYKRDPRDGAPKLLDMNPRVWGWQSLCPRAGVDFSWLLWLLASGAEIPPSEARRGVGWLRLATDTPTAVKEVIRRRLGVREYLRSLRRPREAAIFAWDDPLPGFAELPLLVYVLSRRTLLGETR
jgi:predicted ATP-grasp superfamily ATP-dependent carboligase